MRLYFISTIWFLFLFLPLQTAMGADMVLEENRVVLKDYGPEWVPNEKEIEKALEAIHQYLMNAEKDSNLNEFSKKEIKKILVEFSKYNVQFEGQIEGGKKIIFCNFFQGSFPNWKESFVFVDDGGHHFWQIDYDPETGRCFNFSSNGYA